MCSSHLARAFCLLLLPIFTNASPTHRRALLSSKPISCDLTSTENMDYLMKYVTSVGCTRRQIVENLVCSQPIEDGVITFSYDCFIEEKGKSPSKRKSSAESKTVAELNAETVASIGCPEREVEPRLSTRVDPHISTR